MNEIQTAPLVWYNGNIVPKEKLNLFFDVSLFKSINFIETYFTNGTDILFQEETISRIRALTSIYKIDSLLLKDRTGETLINETRRLLIRNFTYKTSRCYLLFNRDPGKRETNEFLFTEPYPELFNKDKILKKAVISSNFLKPRGNVMNLPTIENEFRKMIQLEFNREDADDCIILNQEQQIVESFHGNIFLINEQRAITPSMKSGCSFQLMRGVVLRGLNELGFEVSEPDEVKLEELFDAREVIVAGTSGIYSLRGVEYKRYFDDTRRLLLEKISPIV